MREQGQGQRDREPRRHRDRNDLEVPEEGTHIAVEVVHSPASNAASDHHPVMVEFRIRPS